MTAFERFAERKTREAAAAALPPYVTDCEDPPANATAIGNSWSRRLFDGPFYISPAANPQRPACSLVFVQSSDGNTVTRDPSSLGGGQTDLHLIYEGLSRVAADAVLAGAETVRGSRLVFSVWHPELVAMRAGMTLPRHPLQIVATLSGLNLDEALLFNVPEIRVALLTVKPAAERMQEALSVRPWITPVLMDSQHHLADAFAEIRSMGVARMSCIGGRMLARQLLRAGLIDDVYLTTGIRKGGEANTPLFDGASGGRPALRKHGTDVEQGVVFEQLVYTSTATDST